MACVKMATAAATSRLAPRSSSSASVSKGRARRSAASARRFGFALTTNTGGARRICEMSGTGGGVASPNEGGIGEEGKEWHERVSTPQMAGSLGSFGGATLEKSGLDFSQKQAEVTPKLDDPGGGGGNGKSINNGGGGDGDDDDDDEWFDDEDDDGEGEGGFFHRREPLPELFDRATIECILQEWFKTLSSLPTGIRQAVEMGLVSSVQLVRFMTTAGANRPTMARFVSRTLPTDGARAFVGRMMGDSAFVFKFAFEQALTTAAAIGWEIKSRGSALSKEWDLAATNVVALLASNAAIVWALSPSRSWGSAQKYTWQRVLHSLPHNVFDKSGPQRTFTYATRAFGLLNKGAQLAVVGAVVGAAWAGASQLALKRHKAKDPEFEPSVSVPSFNQSVLGNAALLGVSGNMRYQLLAGADRWMFANLQNLQMGMIGTGLLRMLNNTVSEPTRVSWLGIEVDTPEDDDVVSSSPKSSTQTRAFAGFGRRRSVAAAVADDDEEDEYEDDDFEDDTEYESGGVTGAPTKSFSVSGR